MKFRRTVTMLAWAAMALMVASCNLFNPNTGSPADDFTPVVQRPLPAEFTSRKAVAYSGYRIGQSPGTQVYPEKPEILHDLGLLLDGGFNLIRLYDSSTHAVRTLEVIDENNLDIKVMLGIWIAGSDAAFGAANDAQIAEGIRLANLYDEIVLAVSVGNEILVDWSFIPVPPADLVEYLQQVRAAVAQPVGTDDNWEPFSLEDEAGNPYPDDVIKVAASVDFLAIHTYAYWDSNYDLWNWRQLEVDESLRAAAMMDAALEYSKANLRAVRTALAGVDLDVPLVIGETGWQNAGYPARAHPVNQKMYYDRIDAWVYGDARDEDSPLVSFWFEAFNEPWKGSDDNWGLFDVDREPRYVIKDMEAYSSLESPDADRTDADALYFKEVAANPTITSNTYVVYRDAPVNSETEAQPTVDPNSGEPLVSWIGWDNNPQMAKLEPVTEFWEDTSDTTQAWEGANCVKVTPMPKYGVWGGLLEVTYPEDLSQFAAGYLNFSIKTTYTGKLEVGFLTGRLVDGDNVDVYLPIASGQYGYVNDGEWHEVSIPINMIVPQARRGWNQENATTPSTADLATVTNAFVIADRPTYTGNTAVDTDVIYLDNIYWSK
jgi:exo-beta-1,3-glucanase (GH17 family)